MFETPCTNCAHSNVCEKACSKLKMFYYNNKGKYIEHCCESYFCCATCKHFQIPSFTCDSEYWITLGIHTDFPDVFPCDGEGCLDWEEE